MHIRGARCSDGSEKALTMPCIKNIQGQKYTVTIT